MPFYFLKTFGCQMNVSDSEYLSGQLEKMGYTMTLDYDKADFVILNTCCVRAKVEQKIYSMAGRISKIKKQRPKIIFGICGCLAQKEKENIIERLPEVDLVFGPSQITYLPEILDTFNKKAGKSFIQCDNKTPWSLKDKSIKRQNNITAYIQIMKGCNNFCSYCIVPHVRGPEESRSAEMILGEIRLLANDNYKEIMLLGQNVNSYGQDLNDKDSFLKLLKSINSIEGIERVRFMTSHPKDFNLELIEMIKNSSKFCEHIHLPLQSGSNKILRKMNRQYNMKQYYNIINNIRKYIPRASITTDIMVGFPEETEEDFQETMQALQKIHFDSVYSFIYSNRKKTLSPFLGEDIPLNIKKKRLWSLLELQKNISIEKNQDLVHKTVEVLVESSSKKGIKKQYWGKTRTNKVVVFAYPFEGNLLGQLVAVQIKKADAYTLYGELLDAKYK